MLGRSSFARSGRTNVPLLALGLALAAGVPAFAGSVTDPAGDFISSYSAALPKNGDLDVVSAEVTFSGSLFHFSATMNGTIGTTPHALYVFGLNRGAGTARFAAIGRDGVLFDSVVLLSTDSAVPSRYNDLIVAANSRNLLPSEFSLGGNQLSADLPVSLFKSQGFDPQDYTWNLWPRVGAGNNNQISDFAPDNSMARTTPVPEPTSVLLCAVGGFFLAGMARRRKAHV